MQVVVKSKSLRPPYLIVPFTFQDLHEVLPIVVDKMIIGKIELKSGKVDF